MVNIEYKNGNGEPRKRRIIRRAPKINKEWMHLKLGQMYYYGVDVEPDYEKALEHFKVAAEKGIQEAAHYIELIEHSNKINDSP